VMDAESNKGVSIHNQCSSWGGDMIADANGNLYVFSMRNHVFQINLNTRVATHLGSIKNLPQGFTVNGAAVDADGNVIVSSANNTSGYYKVNMSSLEANKIDQTDKDVFNASDLATGALLNENLTSKVTVQPEVLANDAVTIAPNPVTNRFFNVQFNSLEAGNYTLAVSDASGRRVLSKVVTVGSKGQVERVAINAVGGLYYVQVLNGKKAVFTSKLVIQQ
jgi:hypothetical protein